MPPEPAPTPPPPASETPPPRRFDSRVQTYEHIQFVQRLMGRVIAELLRRQEAHDQSKLHSPEVEVFDEFTPNLRQMPYGGGEYRACLAAMKPALDHHYAHNPHHPEHYAVGPDGEIDPEQVKDGQAVRRMSLLDLVEMLCDWVAASTRQPGGDVRKSIEMNRQRFGYGDELKQIFLNTLTSLAVCR